jgi:prevent-host-death family protein
VPDPDASESDRVMREMRAFSKRVNAAIVDPEFIRARNSHWISVKPPKFSAGVSTLFLATRKPPLALVKLLKTRDRPRFLVHESAATRKDHIRTTISPVATHPSRNTAMKYSTQVKPISYLKSHAAEIIRDISETREPMLITQNGEAKLVVMDVRSYEEQEETLALLKLLAMGNREIEQGHFRNADEVFADIDREAGE